MTDPKENLIELMAIHEETLSQLYQLYAQKFDYYRDFWNDIASEEIDHARWLHALKEKADHGEFALDEHLFKLPAVDASLNNLNGKVAQARMENIPVMTALSISADLENTMLESNFFIVFQGDSPELKKIFAELEDATATHAHKIKDLLDAQGQLPVY